ncbi:hypothetical protein PoB_004931200 [Plakobranchus ocellatus]|uniref:Uncharacterized protein n=1 Tax=Plakobranchus ocellatus TaxID=259542 RepID=A0AAV4BTT2_9GAST|nr:hypothetical protein PoB_004931200 [Plakobranchus ocellatus]
MTESHDIVSPSHHTSPIFFFFCVPRCNHKIFNKEKIKPRSWFCGFLKCAKYKTTRDNAQGSKVIIVDKSQDNHPRCGECDMDVDRLKATVY